MSKPSKKQTKKSHRRLWMIYAGIFVALCLAIIAVVVLIGNKDGNQGSEQTSFYQDATLHQTKSEQLTDGLLLQGVGSYTGTFLEDGSGDQVTNVMIIQLKNTGKRDLQLANLSLTYSDDSAEFEITNLPAGATMIVLEKNRKPYSEERYLNMSLENVAYFNQNLDVDSDFYEITGANGSIYLKNVSDSAVEGDIYVTYKYFSDDVFFGGVTFRAKVAGGLKAGETKQISAAHFNPYHCVVVQIRTGG